MIMSYIHNNVVINHREVHNGTGNNTRKRARTRTASAAQREEQGQGKSQQCFALGRFGYVLLLPELRRRNEAPRDSPRPGA